jgi:hypothetical protein
MPSLSNAFLFSQQEEYKKDYIHYYVKQVYTKGPSETGAEYPIPVPETTDFRDVPVYRYFNIKKETFIWEPNTG